MRGSTNLTPIQTVLGPIRANLAPTLATTRFSIGRISTLHSSVSVAYPSSIMEVVARLCVTLSTICRILLHNTGFATLASMDGGWTQHNMQTLGAITVVTQTTTRSGKSF